MTAAFAYFFRRVEANRRFCLRFPVGGSRPPLLLTFFRRVESAAAFAYDFWRVKADRRFCLSFPAGGIDRHICLLFPASGSRPPPIPPKKTISVVVNTHLLEPFLSVAAAGAVDTLVLPLPDHPSLPPGVEHVRDLPSHSHIAALMHALAALHPHILRWARSTPTPPSAILSDFFLGWTHHLAADLGVPRLAFYTSGPLLVSVLGSLFRRLPRPEDGEGPASIIALPGLPSFPYAHLPSFYRRCVAFAGDPEWEFARDTMLANDSCWGAVFNTFDALEGPYLARLRREYGHPRVWAVGPIAPVVPAAGRGGRSSVPAEEATAWLDACPPRSVVYVCFGSQFSPTLGQGRALAAALELSGIRFVWAVGSDQAEDGAGAAVVPDGYEERVAGRGLVIRGWAPQVPVLGHGAVGSFLTHCGWNSVLEGIAAGVTLLAWPMQADQFVNAALLVEEAGVAVRACEGAGTVPDPEALARVLAESVTDEAWPELRARAAEMRRAALEAVGEGGSSFKDLEELVKELSDLSIKK